MRVRDVAVRPPVTVPSDASVRDAARAMAAGGVGSVIVVDGDRPVGVVTDRDLVVRSMARDLPVDARVDAVMSMGVVAVDHDADVGDAVRIFGTHAFRRLPVVEGHRVVGVVAVDDLLISLTNQLADVTRGLSAQVLFPHGGDEPMVPMVTK
jgi:signal-transduction protein with cAMP-binding, CBS, and nucleotidyltransferase domain